MLCSLSFRDCTMASARVKCADRERPAPSGMEKGEQPTGSLQIDIDPGPEAFPEQLGCFVVNGPASHVDGLEPLGHRADHCIRVAVADQAVIPKQPAERGKRQMVTKDWRPVLSDDGYDQPPVGQGKGQPI